MLWLYDPRADPSRVYYGTDTRAVALLVGALLASWAAGRRAPTHRPTYLRAGPVELPVPGVGALGLAGLAGFVGLAVGARDLAPWLYRGGFLLVAVCCAALIAGATRSGADSLVARGLSWPPLRAIGLISYGLYLWHWPVYVVLDPDRTGLAGPALLGVRLATTAVLAMLSFRLVEQPVRRGRWPPATGPVRPRVVAAAAAAVVAVAAVAATASAPTVATVRPDVPAAAGAVRTFIIGDSVAWVLWSKVRQETVPDLEVRGSTQLGCGLIAVPVVVDDQVEPLGPTCDQFDARWPGEVAAYRPDVAVLMLGVGEQFDRRVDGHTLRFGTPPYRRFLEGELDRRVALLGGGVRPVVLVTVPCHQARETGVSQNPVIINDEHRVQWLNAVQRRYVRSHTDQVRLVDLHGFLCPDGYTDAVGGVDPLHTDGVHFTRAGVQLIWRWLGPQLVDIARGMPSEHSPAP
jgi:peptidoglycan/LPS O-acetylase OafA/YrhL